MQLESRCQLGLAFLEARLWQVHFLLRRLLAAFHSLWLKIDSCSILLAIGGGDPLHVEVVSACLQAASPAWALASSQAARWKVIAYCSHEYPAVFVLLVRSKSLSQGKALAGRDHRCLVSASSWHIVFFQEVWW